jgi:hypothetical protein
MRNYDRRRYTRERPATGAGHRGQTEVFDTHAMMWVLLTPSMYSSDSLASSSSDSFTPGGGDFGGAGASSSYDSGSSSCDSGSSGSSCD